MALKTIKINVHEEDIEQLDEIALEKNLSCEPVWSRSACIREAIGLYLAHAKATPGLGTSAGRR